MLPHSYHMHQCSVHTSPKTGGACFPSSLPTSLPPSLAPGTPPPPNPSPTALPTSPTTASTRRTKTSHPTQMNLSVRDTSGACLHVCVQLRCLILLYAYIGAVYVCTYVANASDIRTYVVHLVLSACTYVCMYTPGDFVIW